MVRTPISHHRLLFRSRARPQLAPVKAPTLGEIALQLLIDGSLAIWVIANDQSLLLLAIEFEMFRITFGFGRVEGAVRLGTLRLPHASLLYENLFMNHWLLILQVLGLLKLLLHLDLLRAEISSTGAIRNAGFQQGRLELMRR